MRFAAAALHLLGLAVLVVGLLSTLLHAQLDDGAPHSSRPVHTRRALGGAAAPQQVPLGSFARVALDVPMASSAASGLAVLVRPGSTLLALANFYGKSTLYELDDGLRARRVQSFATAAAHDMEVAELPGGVTQFVCAEYDSKQGSLVFQLQERGAIPPAALAGWPHCTDTQEGCADWASSGECSRNPGFMESSCPQACGTCAGLSGPLVAVQLLPGLGGTSARHLRLPSHAGARDLLFVANYKEAAKGVAVYEWSDVEARANGGAGEAGAAAGAGEAGEAGEAGKAGVDGGGGGVAGGGAAAGRHAWRRFGHLDLPGAGEFAHCPVASTGEHLVVVSTWFTDGSFTAPSWVLAYDAAGREARAAFATRQQLTTHGSHDAECFARAGQTWLLLANGRTDGGSRDVPTRLYRYDACDGCEVASRRFVEVQALPTVGAHDIELVTIGSTLLAVVANGASWSAPSPAAADPREQEDAGERCDNTPVVWRWDDGQSRFVFFQRLEGAAGCATFVRSWRTRGVTRRRLVAAGATGGGEHGEHGEHGGGGGRDRGGGGAGEAEDMAEDRLLLAVAIERVAPNATRLEDAARRSPFDASVQIFEWRWFPWDS